MKSPAAWLELSLTAAALMAGMVVVMWAQRPAAASCTLPLEASRVLVLSRVTDREHLTTDLASADRIAQRFMHSTGDPAQQQARYVDCQASLILEIATRHGLSPADVGADLPHAH